MTASACDYPSQESIQRELEALERYLGIAPPRGLGKLPPSVRYAEVVAALRAKLCPHKESLIAKLKSDGGDLVSIIADALGAHFAGLDVPLVSLARCLGVLGLAEFCKSPSDIFPK